MTGPTITTPDDLDLIEAAGRAAGYETRRHEVRGLEAVHVREPGGSEWRYFNPLGDDAEAFRLSVRLELDIRQERDKGRVSVWCGFLGTGFIPYDGDPLASTRRGIVLAAGEAA